MESWESVYVVDQFISVCDVLRVGLGVNRVVDVFEEHSSMFKRCVRHTRPNGHLDLVADAITMTCVLRALSKVSWAQRRIECAHRVVEKLGASRSIVSAVFEIPSNGRADVGAYSDLLITPLPDGVVTSEDIEHFEGWPLNLVRRKREDDEKDDEKRNESVSIVSTSPASLKRYHMASKRDNGRVIWDRLAARTITLDFVISKGRTLKKRDATGMMEQLWVEQAKIVIEAV
eukprot:jgi/Mesvir1/20009/Mv13264-RA.1